MPQPKKPPDSPPEPPTLDELREIAEAATAAAAEAKSSAEAAKAASGAVRKESDERGLDLPEDLIKQIGEASAAATIGQLDARGAFRPTAEPEPAGEPEGEGEPEGDPEPPAPSTFAERFLHG